jgi:hypothetical protein
MGNRYKTMKLSIAKAVWTALFITFSVASAHAVTGTKQAPLPLFGVSAMGALGVGVCIRMLKRRKP